MLPTLPPRPRVLDLGCGTGALALSVLRECPGATAVAVDLDPAAVALTRDNAARQPPDDAIAARLAVVHGDFTAPALALPAPTAFDAVVSNPPYLTTADMTQLQREVQHESRLALDGGSGDGLGVTRSCAWAAGSVWRPGLG